jgi:hypothetical protein
MLAPFAVVTTLATLCRGGGAAGFNHFHRFQNIFTTLKKVVKALLFQSTYSKFF